MQFLIVDDSECPRKFLQRAIAELGHRVAGTAQDGQEAVEQYRALRPDVVIMDVIMPRLDGLEALQAIRAEYPGARVVMICSLKSCQTALDCERLGAVYFLRKPIDSAQLQNVVSRLARELDAGDAADAAAPARAQSG